MIRIAIVDDESFYLSRIESYFSDFLKSNSMEYELNVFPSGVELIESVKRIMYDILVLDIEMPGISGIDIAKYVRKMNSDITIIFVTNMDDLVFESIKYAPYRFIRKTKMKEEMPELLNALKNKFAGEDVSYTFTYNGETKHIKIREIMYFESFGHDIFVYLSVGEGYRTSDTLNSILEKLEKVGFIRIHKSYIVNYRHIYEFKRNCIVLDNKTELPMSKNRVSEIKKEFLNFNRKETL